MRYWSKASITVYKYLGTMTKTIDKIIHNITKTSNSLISQKSQSTYSLASNLIELMDRKRKMINLKVSVEDALNRMDKEGKRIITLAYFDSCKSDQISEILGVSLRTYFRKKAMAFNKFTQILKEIGYDESFFEMEYSQEKWFMAIYNDRVIKGITTEEVPDKKLVKEMFNELSKFNIAYNSFLN